MNGVITVFTQGSCHIELRTSGYSWSSDLLDQKFCLQGVLSDDVAGREMEIPTSEDNKTHHKYSELFNA